MRERALLLEDWNEVDRQADALLRRMADEPLAYASLIADRAHNLAQSGRGQAAEADDQNIRLRDVIAAGAKMKIDALGITLRNI